MTHNSVSYSPLVMTRRNRTYEFDGAQQVCDDALECMTDLFPKARVELSIARFDGEVGVAAKIIGDTAPHIPADIIECLGELGVQHVSREKL